jgi:hypothetical protein
MIDEIRYRWRMAPRPFRRAITVGIVAIMFGVLVMLP